MSRRSTSLAVAALAVLFAGTPASGGIIRHDRADSLYTDLAAESQFAPVGQLTFGDGPGRASGTLIGDAENQWLLTAAHNYVIPNALGNPLPSKVRFGNTETDVVEAILDTSQVYFTSGTTIVGLQDRIFEPDLALVKLAEPVSITPAKLYDANLFGTELGRTGTYVGFGVTGDGIAGPNTTQENDPGDPTAGLKHIKRAGQNVIEAIAQLGLGATPVPPPPGGGGPPPPPPSGEPTSSGGEPPMFPAMPDFPDFLWADFDHPGDPSWNLVDPALPFGSDPTALDLEYTPAPGDSGGSMFIQHDNEWYLAGVISGGTDPFLFFDWFELPDGQWVLEPVPGVREEQGVFSYGLTMSVAPVSQNLDWIQTTMMEVPEPSTLVMLVGGCLAGCLVVLSKRRRTAASAGRGVSRTPCVAAAELSTLG